MRMESDHMDKMTDFEFIDGYLERIDLPMLPNIDPDGLTMLQTNHIRHIPFENLDIINGNIPLSLEVSDLWDKIVTRKRGGICYEQNILFAAVLEKLGFKVKRMASHHPLRGRNEYDHMFLMVDFPSLGESWISDVGFADNMHAPIRFKTGVWQSDMRDMLRLDDMGYNKYVLVRRNSVGEEDGMYEFNLTEHTNDQYRERCDWFSTNEESRFKKGPFASIDTFGGRTVLTSRHLYRYLDGEKVTVDVEGPEHFNALLEEEFGIVL